jgi:maltose O-acetyltransferase
MKQFLFRFLGYIYGTARKAYYERRYALYRKHHNIKTDFGFNGTDIRIYGIGKLEVGNKSYIGSNSTIQLSENTIVKIGEKCSISHNVRIYTSSPVSDQDFTKALLYDYGDVIIEHAVWIGANVFINPGVKIGYNSIVGANSVVTKDIPANSIAVGTPARVIKQKTNPILLSVT